MELEQTDNYEPVGASFTSTTHSEPYTYLDSAKHLGHRVLITGGTRGIGRAIAISFAKAGASGAYEQQRFAASGEFTVRIGRFQENCGRFGVRND